MRQESWLIKTDAIKYAHFLHIYIASLAFLIPSQRVHLDVGGRAQYLEGYSWRGS